MEQAWRRLLGVVGATAATLYVLWNLWWWGHGQLAPSVLTAWALKLAMGRTTW